MISSQISDLLQLVQHLISQKSEKQPPSISVAETLPKTTVNLLVLALYRDLKIPSAVTLESFSLENYQEASETIKQALSDLNSKEGQENITDKYPFWTKIIYYFYSDFQKIIPFSAKKAELQNQVNIIYEHFLNKWGGYMDQARFPNLFPEEITFFSGLEKKLLHYFSAAQIISPDNIYYQKLFTNIFNEEFKNSSFPQAGKARFLQVFNPFLSAISSDMSELGRINEDLQSVDNQLSLLNAWLALRLSLLVLPPKAPSLELIMFLSEKILQELFNPNLFASLQKTEKEYKKDLINFFSRLFSPDSLIYSFNLQNKNSPVFSEFIQNLSDMVLEEVSDAAYVLHNLNLSSEQQELFFNNLFEGKVFIEDVFSLNQ